jgi:hypothetical protein
VTLEKKHSPFRTFSLFHPSFITTRERTRAKIHPGLPMYVS